MIRSKWGWGRIQVKSYYFKWGWGDVFYKNAIMNAL